jgi:Domain of unknown function (DUF6265)
MARKLLLYFAVALVTANVTGDALRAQDKSASGKSKVADLAWLAGVLKYEAGENTFEEVWLAPVGEVMTGVGRHTKASKHTSHEFLRIAVIEGEIQYETQPSGQKLTLFKLTKLNGQEAVFENPSHDFPTTVSYQREGDALTARIERIRGDRVVGIEFKFKKAALP